jgi:hypothetical protein
VKAYGVTVEIHRSVGTDGAIVVQIDTEFEPDGSDGIAGLRVYVNDSEAYVGVPLGLPPEQPPTAWGPEHPSYDEMGQ